MKIALVVVALGAIAALVVSATGAFTSDSREREERFGRPILVQTSADPLRFRGTGFVPGETVRVAVGATGRPKLTKKVRAGASGTFAVSFGTVDTCNGLTGSAVGNRGSRTSFQLSQFLCLGAAGS